MTQRSFSTRITLSNGPAVVLFSGLWRTTFSEPRKIRPRPFVPPVLSASVKNNVEQGSHCCHSAAECRAAHPADVCSRVEQLYQRLRTGFDRRDAGVLLRLAINAQNRNPHNAQFLQDLQGSPGLRRVSPYSHYLQCGMYTGVKPKRFS